MSKKSRKRNKKILAAIGLGLGAAALASKKKAALGSTEDGKGGIDTIAKAKQSMTKDNAYKSDSKKSTATTKTKVDTERKKSMAETSTVPEKRPGITVYGDGSIKAKDKSSGNQVNYANKEKYSTRTDTKPPGANGGTNKPFSLFDPKKSSFAQNKAKQGLRSGGRANYKSGGSAKGCGKALRGFGKAMKGKR